MGARCAADASVATGDLARRTGGAVRRSERACRVGCTGGAETRVSDAGERRESARHARSARGVRERVVGAGLTRGARFVRCALLAGRALQGQGADDDVCQEEGAEQPFWASSGDVAASCLHLGGWRDHCVRCSAGFETGVLFALSWLVWLVYKAAVAFAATFASTAPSGNYIGNELTL